MPYTVDSPEYWQSFTVAGRDLDRVEDRLLEAGTPQALGDLAELVIRGRLDDIAAERPANDAEVRLYQPKYSYEVGQRLRFSALNNAQGVVVGMRAGENPDLGGFSVIRVRMDRGGEREFAVNYAAEHPLNADAVSSGTTNALSYTNQVARVLAQRLAQSPDYVAFGDLWFRRDLLPDVNISHLIIAEAVIDVAGEAQSTSTLLKDVELSGAEPTIRAFALNVALAQDPERRFVNVGTPAAPRWALRQGVAA